ncbi:MAG: Holliday junction branch migration protein RuvA [Verrucomicrobiales bacterium]
MIAFLRGSIARNLPNLLWLDVNGVGYAVHVPMGSFDAKVEGEKVQVLTHLIVREDAHTLYGFPSEEAREIFLLLIERVTGVGPKMAMAILGGLSVGDFKDAVVSGDLARLSKISGVGKKTAERIVLELKDKVGVTEVWKLAAASKGNPAEAAANDAVLGLLALGYKQADALNAVRKVLPDLSKDGQIPAPDEIIRSALRALN